MSVYSCDEKCSVDNSYGDDYSAVCSTHSPPHSPSSYYEPDGHPGNGPSSPPPAGPNFNFYGETQVLIDTTRPPAFTIRQPDVDEADCQSQDSGHDSNPDRDSQTLPDDENNSDVESNDGANENADDRNFDTYDTNTDDENNKNSVNSTNLSMADINLNLPSLSSSPLPPSKGSNKPDTPDPVVAHPLGISTSSTKKFPTSTVSTTTSLIVDPQIQAMHDAHTASRLAAEDRARKRRVDHQKAADE